VVKFFGAPQHCRVPTTDDPGSAPRKGPRLGSSPGKAGPCERGQQLTVDFLGDRPLFAAVADEFLAFVGDAPLVAHNAGFDIAFLNAELKRIAKPVIATERVIDTLVLARRKHAGNNTLDDLCSRNGVDRSRRTQHGALLDAAVYVELATTQQSALQLEPIAAGPSYIQAIVRVRPKPLPRRATADDRNAHREFHPRARAESAES
jgi:DNA polymerase III subunit epsilon